MIDLNMFVEIRDVKNRCDICKADIHPLESNIFDLRGKIRCVCNQCADKIEALFPDADKQGVPNYWI